MARKLVVEIVGDASSLEKAFGKAGKETKRFGGTLGSLGKAAAFTAGGAALGGLFVTLNRGIGEFKESEKVAAQTAAVIKSTGKAAGVTAKHVDTLATSISNYSGIDDEAVAAGENMLLTFTNIRNETGKGNKIFDQATKILTDMSVATGTDMSKSAIQLGKALNDPIKGVGSLSRVGVTFTKEQKKQIKTLVDSGKTMEAQKIILRELGKEFGGSAKAAGDTFGGSMDKLRNAFDNLAGTIVGAAAPAVQRFADKISVWLSKAENQERVTNAVKDAFKILGSVVNTVKGAFEAIWPKVDAVVQVFGGWKRVIEAIILLKVASKIYGIADSFVRLGSDAKGAKGQVGGLAGSIKKLPKSVSIPLLVTAGVIFAYPWVKKFFEQFLGADFSGLSKEPAESIPNPARKALHGKAGMSSAHTGTGPTVSGGPKKGFGVTSNSSKIGFDVGGIAAGAAGVGNAMAGGGIVINGPVTVIANNPEQFLKQLQKKARRSAPSRAGRFGGTNLGLT